MSKPILSIVIPVYNIKDYILRCIDSIIQQKPSIPIEILLIDDGSTDGSSELCNQLASKYFFIKAIHQENGGVSSARNKGIFESSGEWIWFIDGDDYLLPKAVDNLIPSLNEKDDIIAFAYIQEINATEKRIVLPSEKDVTRYKGAYYMNTSYSSPTVWSYIFRRSLIVDNHVTLSEKLKYGEDKIFILECLYYADTVALIMEPLYEYVYREGSAVNSANARIVTDQLESIKILINTIREKNLKIRTFDSQINYILWLYLHLLSNTSSYIPYKTQERALYKYCKDHNYWNVILFIITYFHPFAIKHHNGFLKRVIRRIQWVGLKMIHNQLEMQ